MHPTIESLLTILIIILGAVILALVIIAVLAWMASRITETRHDMVNDFRLPLVLESTLSWEIEEGKYFDPRPANDSGIHSEWDDETNVSEG